MSRRPARPLTAEVLLYDGIGYDYDTDQAIVLKQASVYNVETQRVTSLATPAIARYGATANRLGNGDILIVGGATMIAPTGTQGVDRNPAATNVEEIFHPSDGSFRLTGKLRFARFGHSAVRSAAARGMRAAPPLSSDRSSRQPWAR